MSSPKSSTGKSSAPYGHWESPITAAMVAKQRNSVQDIISSGKSLLWLKCMSEEDGRLSIHSLPEAGEETSEYSPSPFNVRSKVHEYGGGACLYTDDAIYISNFKDQRLYRIYLSKTQTPSRPEPITPEGPFRYADATWDAKRKRIICVMENHSGSKEKPLNSLVEINPENGVVDTLCCGADFYAAPSISHDSNKLCWLSWKHPFMPWDSTYLWAAEFDSTGRLENKKHIAGSDDESVVQPKWAEDGSLYFISDKNNWWNIYQHKNEQDQAICPIEAEFGKAMWVLGQQTYDIRKNGDIVAAYAKQGQWYIGSICKQSFGKESALKPLLGPYPDIKKLFAINDRLYLFVGQEAGEDQILQYDFTTSDIHTLIGLEHNKTFSGYLSKPKKLNFTTSDDSEINGFYYPPNNQDYSQSPSNTPPLIIKTHGGPTSCANSSLDLSIQFWSSRGFAVFDVNYRGSTGFGRAKRKKLYGNWGLADVEDCSCAADFLVRSGRAHPEQLIIRGHSAGGYTTLAALTFSNTFFAGASYYGISDLKSLALECHKFESYYVQQLLGEPELSASIYEKRSPLFHFDQLDAAVIFFQGALDKVVPPNQAQKMVSALQEKEIAVEYFEFSDEAHGFRSSTNIETALNNELEFYNKTFTL